MQVEIQVDVEVEKCKLKLTFSPLLVGADPSNNSNCAAYVSFSTSTLYRIRLCSSSKGVFIRCSTCSEAAIRDLEQCSPD